MSYAELFSKNIVQSKGMLASFLKDFTDAEMYFRPAKTANHATWQMGHLANSVRGMVTACDPGVVFQFEDDTRFGKSKASIDDPTFFPTKAELLGRFDQAMDTAAGWVAKLSDAELAKPTPDRMQRIRADSCKCRDSARLSPVHAHRPVHGDAPGAGEADSVLRAPAPFNERDATKKRKKGVGIPACFGSTLRARLGGFSVACSRSRHMALAYFITFSTYGTWLHGTSKGKGSVDREHNQHGMAFVEPDALRKAQSREKMKQPRYTMQVHEREIVRDAIVELCGGKGWQLLAVHVRSNHVHVVICVDRDPGRVMSDMKGRASAALTRAGFDDATRKRWTRHGSTLHLFDEATVSDKIDYTLNRQGTPMAWYDGRRGAAAHGG